MNKYTSAGLKGLAHASDYLNEQILNRPTLDNRTSQERREDEKKFLDSITENEIEKYKEKLETLNNLFLNGDKEIIADRRSEFDSMFVRLTHVLDRYKHDISQYKHLNSDYSRKIELKKSELSLEASADWRSKWRLFLFRVLGTLLFITAIFAIGYLEKNYDWATLPLSKYVSSAPKLPTN